MKRLFVFCMMLLIALPLSACGGNTNTEDSSAQNSKETTKATISTESTVATENTTENIAETEKTTEFVPATLKPAEDTSENDNPEENNSSDEDVAKFFVDTEYYTLTAPESWEKDCLYEIHRGENNTYSLVFYDKASHEEISGGKLLTVRLLTESQEYTQYPDYDVLGSIKVDGVGLNAIGIYPTDVQFSPNTAEKYREHQNEVPDIVSTITFKDGYDFSNQPL